MIKKFVNYPWGKKAIRYDSFVYKVVDVDKNVILTEIWASDNDKYKFIQAEFKRLKRIDKEFLEIKDCNSFCYEYYTTYHDNDGSIKLGKNKSQHRILTYIQGFLAEKQ